MCPADDPAGACLDLEPFSGKDEVRRFIADHNNWGRWGADDQLGTLNLITPAHRVAASSLVAEGIAVSMSRPLATEPAAENPYPVHHFMQRIPRGDGAGAAHDYFGVACHGTANTHLDALTHVWDDDGLLYNGVPAAEAVRFGGAAWGALEQWRHGIFTRAILLDIPFWRHEPCVVNGRPVTAAELQEVLVSTGLTLQPGDALVVYCGRERWDETNPTWSSEPTRPGLDVSCIKFLRRYDCSVLAWDMTEQKPIGHDLPWGVHVAIPALGLTLLDSVQLAELVATCRSVGRFEFLLTVNPLVLTGGTGSPVNPVAIF